MNATCLEIELATGAIKLASSVPVDAMEHKLPFLPGTVLRWLQYGAPLPDQRLTRWNFETESLEPVPEAAPDMAALREGACVLVDRAAEATRLRYITPGTGQAMAYQEKYDEAVALILDPSIAETEAPHIFAEVGVTGATAEEVASIVIGMRTVWRGISADIERRRLATKAEINQAQSPAEIDSILSTWSEAHDGNL